jgi:hypothetical protein
MKSLGVMAWFLGGILPDFQSQIASGYSTAKEVNVILNL